MPGDQLHGPEDGEQISHAARPEAAAEQRAADDRVRVERVSPADERQREALEELPPGHPSSPYEANGRRRNDEPDLRSLELPLPDELDDDGREAVVDETATDAPRDPEEEHHDYWTEVPRFQNMWSDHEHEWPEETQPAAAVDRSRDSEGSWRSDSNLFLSPDTHARTKDAIGKVHEAETRVTTDLDHAVKSSPFSGELVGLDYRRKGEDRLKEKVAEALERRPDSTPAEAMQEVNDAIRYTVRFNGEDYTTGCRDIAQRLTDSGHQMFYAKNHWEDAEYKGINTRWTTLDGQRFEVQFHTSESHHAKQEITHGAYERIRNPLTSDNERGELKAFQREVSSWIPAPDGVAGLRDHRKDPH